MQVPLRSACTRVQPARKDRQVTSRGRSRREPTALLQQDRQATIKRISKTSSPYLKVHRHSKKTPIGGPGQGQERTQEWTELTGHAIPDSAAGPPGSHAVHTLHRVTRLRIITRPSALAASRPGTRDRNTGLVVHSLEGHSHAPQARHSPASRMLASDRRGSVSAHRNSHGAQQRRQPRARLSHVQHRCSHGAA